MPIRLAPKDRIRGTASVLRQFESQRLVRAVVHAETFSLKTLGALRFAPVEHQEVTNVAPCFTQQPFCRSGQISHWVSTG